MNISYFTSSSFPAAVSSAYTKLLCWSLQVGEGMAMDAVRHLLQGCEVSRPETAGSTVQHWHGTAEGFACDAAAYAGRFFRVNICAGDYDSTCAASARSPAPWTALAAKGGSTGCSAVLCVVCLCRMMRLCCRSWRQCWKQGQTPSWMLSQR